MITFDSLVDNTIILLDRADLRTEIEKAVIDATLMYHQMAFFDRDKDSAIVHSTQSRGLGKVLVPKEHLRHVRAIELVGIYDSNTDRVCRELQKAESFIGKNCNSWWLSPEGLVINSNLPSQHFYISYWRNPILAPKHEYSSWIADLYPHAIQEAAAMRVAMLIGNESLHQRLLLNVGTRGDGARKSTGYFHQIKSDQLSQEIQVF